jgi:hypothetical protein
MHRKIQATVVAQRDLACLTWHDLAIVLMILHGARTAIRATPRASSDRAFREHIFEPLCMNDTDLVRSERVASRL